MKKIVSIFIILMVLWILLNWNFSTENMVYGLIVSLVLSIILSPFVPINFFYRNFFSDLLKILFLYIPKLIIEIIKANLNMAKIVLSPRLPINPGLIEQKTILPEKDTFKKLLVASSITLTPGTLTVNIDKDTYLIHVVEKQKYKDNRSIISIFDRFFSKK